MLVQPGADHADNDEGGDPGHGRGRNVDQHEPLGEQYVVGSDERDVDRQPTLRRVFTPCMIIARLEAFYRERGVELRETPPWQLYETYGETRVVSTDPPHVEFDLHVEGETAVVTVDGRGNVVDFDRP